MKKRLTEIRQAIKVKNKRAEGRAYFTETILKIIFCK